MPYDTRAPEMTETFNTPKKSSGSEASQSYIVSCPSKFRDDVLELAEARRVSAADLARGVLLLVSEETVNATTDPGDAQKGDREEVTLRSGPSEGRVLRRKPRLQLRLQHGLDHPTIRRALALALSMDGGNHALNVETQDDMKRKATAMRREQELEDENRALRDIIDTLSFEPFKNGVMTRGDALHVLGFAPASVPDQKSIKTRFRKLAMIYHPDSPLGDHPRMSQLNDALNKLTR